MTYLQLLPVWDVHEIRGCAFTTDKPLFALQCFVHNTEKAECIVNEAFACFWVWGEAREGEDKAEVGTLRCRLAKRPLIEVGAVCRCGSWEGDLVLRVVGLEEVLNDSPGLPDRDILVRVFDHGREAVRIELCCEWRFLLVRCVPDSGLVGNGQLIEDESDFPRVRAAWKWSVDEWTASTSQVLTVRVKSDGLHDCRC